MKKLILMGLISFPLVFAGCSTTEEGAVGGALGGAGLGALIGHATGGDAGKGALIGAAAGGLVGAAVGSENEHKAEAGHGSSGGERVYQVGPSGNQIDVSGFPPGSVVRDPYTNETFVVQ